MFIYLVAIVATLFIIFGLIHTRCLPAIPTSLNNDLDNTLITARPLLVTNERLEYEEVPTQRTMFSKKERLSDVILGEAENKARSLNQPRYSFENVRSEEKDKNFGLPAIRTLQLGTMQEEVIKPSTQVEKENIYESLKSSIERTTPMPYSRLNTIQIYNLLLKEKLKENAEKHKLLESDRNKFTESFSAKIADQLPSSSENTDELQDDKDEHLNSK